MSKGSSGGFKGTSGGGGSGSKNAIAETINRIQNPSAKQDYIDRLEVLNEIGAPGYRTEISMRDWQNYGKDRTYLKIDAYRESDNKFHHSYDFGYYDNQKKTYVSTKKYNTLDTSKIYTLSGSSIDNSQLEAAVKAVNKRKRK